MYTEETKGQKRYECSGNERTYQTIKVEDLVTVIDHFTAILAQPPNVLSDVRGEIAEVSSDEKEELGDVETE